MYWKRNGCNGIGGLPERDHQSARSWTIERAQESILANRIEDHRQFLAAGDTGNFRYEILFRIEDRVAAAMGMG